jgi:DNA-binding transcriptional MerR regulator
MADDLTIDELARRADTRTSTVRMYQTRGLLPPPDIRGRVGYYSSAHLARLRVIDRLQRRGFSLAAIKDLLENWSRGASLAAVLGGEQDLASFGEPTELSEADFAALFPDGHVDPAVVQRAVSLGLMAYDAERGTVRAPSRAFVEIGRELAAHRIPPARALREFEQVAQDVRRIADRFVALFDEYVTDGTPGSERDGTLDETVLRFRGMAATAVQELMLQAIDDARRASAARPAETDRGKVAGRLERDGAV